MSKVYNSVTELIGHTPLLKANNFIKANNLQADILVKLEYFNPAGSVKDRIAKGMIEKAEAEGKLTKDSVIIEPTSGNTGIGLASVAAARGHARDYVCGTPQPAEGLWCRDCSHRWCQGHEGCYCQG